MFQIEGIAKHVSSALTVFVRVKRAKQQKLLAH
jgi:hypothetical protein